MTASHSGPAGRTFPGLALFAAVLLSAALATPSPAPAQLRLPTAVAVESGGSAGTAVVQVERLEAPDPESVGVLGPSDGGLGPDIWRGSSRAEVARLVEALPAPAASPVLTDLARRTLASAARAPDGATLVPSLAAVRVRKLADLGAVELAADLARVMPPELGDRETWARALDAGWLAGEPGPVCDIARAALGAEVSIETQAAVAVCQALRGEEEAARLSLALLRDQGHDDRAFFALTEALLRGEAPAKPVAIRAEPLHLALARFAEAPLPEGFEAPTPTMQAAVARSPNASTAQRLAAAEAAFAAHMLPGRDLASIYRHAGNGPEAAEDSLARRYAQAAQAPSGRVRAEAATGFWRAAAERFGPYAAAAVAAPLIEGIEPDAGYGGLAADFVRISLARWDLERAFAWWRALEAAGRADAAAARLVTEVRPLIAMADSEDPMAWTGGAAGEWLAARRAVAPRDADRQGTILGRLMGALGDGLQALPLYGERGDRLAAASRAGRTGETVLRGILLLDGAVAVERTAEIAAVVDALRRVGLERDARRLALEAALAAGI